MKIFNENTHFVASSTCWQLLFYLLTCFNLFFNVGPLFLKQKICCGDNKDANVLAGVLKLPWTHSLKVFEPQSLNTSKIHSVRVLSKLGPALDDETSEEMLDLSLHNEAEDVVAEAIIAMPVRVLWSGLRVLMHIFRRLE